MGKLESHKLRDFLEGRIKNFKSKSTDVLMNHTVSVIRNNVNKLAKHKITATKTSESSFVVGVENEPNVSLKNIMAAEAADHAFSRAFAELKDKKNVIQILEGGL